MGVTIKNIELCDYIKKNKKKIEHVLNCNLDHIREMYMHSYLNDRTNILHFLDILPEEERILFAITIEFGLRTTGKAFNCSHEYIRLKYFEIKDKVIEYMNSCKNEPFDNDYIDFAYQYMYENEYQCKIKKL